MADNKRLKDALGPLGFLADVLSLLQTNWVLVVGLLISAGAVIWHTTLALVTDERVIVGAAVFLVLLWGFVGVRVITTLGRPVLIKSVADYRYGLSIFNYTVGFNPDDSVASLQLGIGLQNLSTAPAKVRVDQLRLVFGDRTCPENDIPAFVIPRAGTREVRSGAFRREVVADTMSGDLTLHLSYGDPDGAYSRQFRLRATVLIELKKDEKGKYVNSLVKDEHKSLEDVAI